jgi:hypothetical protein
MLMTGENMKTSSVGDCEPAEVSPYPDANHGDSIEQMIDEGYGFLSNAREVLISSSRRHNPNDGVVINSPISSSEKSLSSINRESLIRQNLLGTFNRQGKI